MNFESIIDEAIKNKKALQGSFSGATNKDKSKIKFKTVLMNSKVYLQFETFKDNKAYHENIYYEEAKAKLLTIIKEYKQLFITIEDISYQIFNNNGKIKVLKAKTEKKAKALSHDNKKKLHN